MGLRRFFKNYIYKKKFDIKVSESENVIRNKNILITGANSGIGLALTKRFLDFDNKVIATYKQNNVNLLKIKNQKLILCECDQSNIQNTENLTEYVKKNTVNVIINNKLKFLFLHFFLQLLIQLKRFHLNRIIQL